MNPRSPTQVSALRDYVTNEAYWCKNTRSADEIPLSLAGVQQAGWSHPIWTKASDVAMAADNVVTSRRRNYTSFEKFTFAKGGVESESILSAAAKMSL